MKNTYFTYVLKSQKDGGFYYGYTSNLQNRLDRHNEGLVRSTKARRPFVIHYFEEFEDKSSAIKRENFFKTIDGYNWLRDNSII